MAKFKLGEFEVEGEPDEIETIFKSQSFDVNKYLKKDVSHNTFKVVWIVIPVAIYFLLCCCLYIGLTKNPTWIKVEILSVFLFLAVAIILIHIKLNNVVVSIASSIFGILITLISLGAITPEEAARTIQNHIPKVNNEKDK